MISRFGLDAPQFPSCGAAILKAWESLRVDLAPPLPLSSRRPFSEKLRIRRCDQHIPTIFYFRRNPLSKSWSGFVNELPGIDLRGFILTQFLIRQSAGLSGCRSALRILAFKEQPQRAGGTEQFACPRANQGCGSEELFLIVLFTR